MAAYATPVAPTVLFPGIRFATSDGSGDITSGIEASTSYVLLDVTATTGDFPAYETAGLVTGHSDAADVCQLLYALLHGITAAYNTAFAVEADKPPHWVSALSSTIDSTTGEITRNYYNQFITGVSGEEVVHS